MAETEKSGKNQPKQDVPNKKGPSQDTDRESDNKQQKQGDKGGQRHAS